jgi:hypothetical protein
MNDETSSAKLASLEQRVAGLTARLSDAKAVVQQWADANTSLSRSAAEARAENQSSGRGFIAGLLGSKYRGAMRSAAASSNASIAKNVADKRTQTLGPHKCTSKYSTCKHRIIGCCTSGLSHGRKVSRFPLAQMLSFGRYRVSRLHKC